MNAILHIQLSRGIAAIERLLGVIRFRGFEVERLNLHAQGDSTFSIIVEVKPLTSRHRIVEHLAKLRDVEGLMQIDLASGISSSQVRQTVRGAVG